MPSSIQASIPHARLFGREAGLLGSDPAAEDDRLHPSGVQGLGPGQDRVDPDEHGGGFFPIARLEERLHVLPQSTPPRWTRLPRVAAGRGRLRSRRRTSSPRLSLRKPETSNARSSWSWNASPRGRSTVRLARFLPVAASTSETFTRSRPSDSSTAPATSVPTARARPMLSGGRLECRKGLTPLKETMLSALTCVRSSIRVRANAPPGGSNSRSALTSSNGRTAMWVGGRSRVVPRPAPTHPRHRWAACRPRRVRASRGARAPRGGDTYPCTDHDEQRQDRDAAHPEAGAVGGCDRDRLGPADALPRDLERPREAECDREADDSQQDDRRHRGFEPQVGECGVCHLHRYPSDNGVEDRCAIDLTPLKLGQNAFFRLGAAESAGPGRVLPVLSSASANASADG